MMRLFLFETVLLITSWPEQPEQQQEQQEQQEQQQAWLRLSFQQASWLSLLF